ncbi:hypothetical protein F5Y10DRAFT_252869 [Nemania abortiva]|nr:hypothetical protein F5Y10DRAFT_252869 [Nemania abortiva]
MFIITIFLLALAKAESQIYGPVDIDGASLPNDLNPSSLELVINAQQHPNATRGVVFKPFESGTASIADLEWTWRINVSDFAAPNAEPDPVSGGFQTTDTHIITTSYDFNWLGPQNSSTELSGTAARFCLTVADSLTDLPANITNAYTENDTNSVSCVSTLGQACVDAILSSSRFTGDPINGYCRGPSQIWSGIPACQTTFGYTRMVSRYFDLVTSSRGFSNETSGITNAFTNGGGWFGYFSSPQNGSGSNEYYTAVNRLHVVMVNPILAPQGDFERGYTQNPQLLCMRVNATKLATNDTNGDGVTWTSEAVLEAESIGYSFRRVVGWDSLAIRLISLMFAVTINTRSP